MISHPGGGQIARPDGCLQVAQPVGSGGKCYREQANRFASMRDADIVWARNSHTNSSGRNAPSSVVRVSVSEPDPILAKRIGTACHRRVGGGGNHISQAIRGFPAPETVTVRERCHCRSGKCPVKGARSAVARRTEATILSGSHCVLTWPSRSSCVWTWPPRSSCLRAWRTGSRSVRTWRVETRAVVTP